MPAAHRGRAVGTDLQMGVMQLFSLIQLLALSFATMLLADKEGWRAAALARGTAIIPGACPASLLHMKSLAELDSQFTSHKVHAASAGSQQSCPGSQPGQGGV